MSSSRQLRSSKQPKPKQRATRRRRQVEVVPPQEPSPPCPQLVNTQGFACLAHEIYLEIMSYFPAFPLPTEHGEADIEVYGHRRRTLAALSQTCRSLRLFFLRYRWQRIEVYQRMDLGKGPLPLIRYKDPLQNKPATNMKKYVVELLRQLETVTIRNPELAKFVNVMDIIVADYSPGPVLEELARCISLMPNLGTIQIYFDIHTIDSLIDKSFSAYTYPQIQTVSLSTDALSFLCRCPNAKTVHLLKHFDGGKWNASDYCISRFVKAIAPCTSIETLGPIVLGASSFPLKDDVASFISLLASLIYLRDIAMQISQLPTDSTLQELWKISSLQTIRFIYCNSSYPWIRKRDKREIDEWTERVKKVSRTWVFEGEHKEFIISHSNDMI